MQIHIPNEQCDTGKYMHILSIDALTVSYAKLLVANEERWLPDHRPYTDIRTDTCYIQTDS